MLKRSWRPGKNQRWSTAGGLHALFGLIVFCLEALLPGPATAADWDVFFAGHASLRTGLSGDVRDRFDGGPSRLRYGARADGNRDTLLDVSEIAFEATVDTGRGLSLFAHLHHQPEDDQGIDIVRGFALYETDLSDGLRSWVKGGAFFPGISRENRGIGWTNSYTLTNSAGVAWIGEDVRPVGILAGLGHDGGSVSLALEGGLFFANDATGEVLALGGFALTDIKTPLNGRTRSFDARTPGQPLSVDPFRELDGRPGVQALATLQAHGLGAMSVLYWNNRGDTDDSRPGAGIWNTNFTALSGETVLPGSLTLIPTVMAGRTRNRMGLGTDFFTAALLLSRDLGPVRLAARGEAFTQDDVRAAPPDPLDERGYDVTLAATGLIGTHHQIAAEIVHVHSRRQSLDNAGQDETLLQAEYRFVF
ncbi:MAG: hypothetical protein ACFB6R_01910 [Alphaproteobacteria bacterium]